MSENIIFVLLYHRYKLLDLVFEHKGERGMHTGFWWESQKDIGHLED
jgi:hypothetical protein